jgi:hypothetical protein
MRLTLAAILTGVGLIVLIFLTMNLFEGVDAEKIMVVQSPVLGKMSWYITPGIKWQGFGKVTKYDKRESYQFEIPVRFNDGGHGKMIGSIQYELPLDREHCTNLHVKYGSQKAIETQLIQTIVNKSIYMTGPLMSSKESYAEKRNYLLSYVEDQIQNGVYKTYQKDIKTVDPLTNAEKTVTIVEIAMENGIPQRQDKAVLQEFGIKTFNFAISSLPYDEAVEKQIQQQQKIAMDVQTAIASAKQAEQNVITVAKEGEANAAKAKWEQEVIKAKMVTEAQQKKEVAELERDAAAFTKQKLTLEGEGEGAKKRAIMSADGALEKKLEAWIEVNKLYAEAIKGGTWVPSIVMGGDYKTGTGATGLIDLMMAKTAKDLSLDLTVPKSK